MPKIAIVIGFLLAVIGIAGAAHYAAHATTGSKVAVTALIPVLFGVIFIALGAGSLAKPTLRKHLMHALAAIALIGALASGGRLAMAWSKPGVSEVARASQAAMALLCAVTVGFCVKSFRDARRARELTAA